MRVRQWHRSTRRSQDRVVREGGAEQKLVQSRAEGGGGAAHAPPAHVQTKWAASHKGACQLYQSGRRVPPDTGVRAARWE
jgi:hypothetical protein